MSFDPRRIHEVPDDLLAAIDYCYEQGWTDGLPVIPPAIERVEATLAFEGRPPEAVIATHPATGLQLTVHAAAVNEAARNDSRACVFVMWTSTVGQSIAEMASAIAIEVCEYAAGFITTPSNFVCASCSQSMSSPSRLL